MESAPPREFNAHSNRGRRRTTAEPPSKRAGQMREAQRSLRDRKAKYLRDLETSNALLTQRVAQLEFAALLSESDALSPSLCSECAKRSAISQNINNNNNNSIHEFSSHTPSPHRLDLDTLLHQMPEDPSNEDLRGPVEIESTRIALKSIPSLKNSSQVDALLDIFVQNSRRKEGRVAKKLILALMRALVVILDACTLLERAKVMEYLVVFSLRNANHMVSMHQFWTRSLGPSSVLVNIRPLDLSKPTHQRLQQLKETMLHIPSYADSAALFDEYCTVWMNAFEDHNVESFFQMQVVMIKLEQVGETVEDRAALWAACEIARAGNRNEIEEMVNKMERVNLD
ncbi:hypothetical protein HDU98_000492 [Podochytrium sp. JEL0797]|nr:hypothetical protein HDU98_000492 [Podochytrium sp. JEL0797]